MKIKAAESGAVWYGGKCREIRGIFGTLFTLVKVIWIIERASK